MRVDVDEEKVQTLGIPVTDVYNALQTFLGGLYVNDFNRFGRTWRVIMQADPEYRQNPDSVNRFYVRSSHGDLVPLSTLVKMNTVTGPDVIYRYNRYRAAKLIGQTTPGFSVEKISTPALESVFRTYNTVSDAQADIYSDVGHLFYLLHFPTENVTWAYDLTTGIWCKRGTWVPALNQFVVWRPRWHAQAFGEHRILDASTGALYRMSSTIGTDVDGAGIRRLRRSPIISTGQDSGAQAEVIPNQRLFFASLELAMEVGLGNAVDPGSDPRVMLRQSKDGGRTFGSELWRSAGKLGDYTRRPIWNRMGMARQCVIEVSFTDVTPFRLLALFANLAQPVRGVSRLQVVA
jgi:hypothetical protein